MDTPFLHCADALPAGASLDRGSVHGLSTPGGDNDLGVPADHLVGVHHALAPGSLVTQLREDVATAGQLDDLRHPADARDQRVMPFLEIHARPVRPDAGELPHLTDLVAKVLDQIARGLLEAEQTAHHENGLENL